MRNLRIITELSDFKSSKERYSLTNNAGLKINSFLRKKHGNELDSILLFNSIMSQVEFDTRFYIMETADSDDEICYHVRKGLLKVENSNIYGIAIKLYMPSINEVAIKHWKRLGYKSNILRKVSYNEKFDVAVFKRNNILQVIVGRVDSRQVNKGYVLNEDVKVQLNANIFTVLMDMLYLTYRSEEIIITEAQPKNTNPRPLNPVNTNPWNIHHINGNEHIKYNKTGVKVYDKIKDITYKSHWLCAVSNRWSESQYYHFLEETRNNTNLRFIRI